MMDDCAVVATQLGRVPRSVVEVVARCHLGLPTVIAMPPYLDDGTPFPTRYWLVCPLAVKRIARLESRGGVKAADARISSDPSFASRYSAAMERYARERDALIGDDASTHRPAGGVGGSARGVKCLHAHYADHIAGNDNPVGEITADSVQLLDCEVECVTLIDDAIQRNPEWRERGR